MNNATPETGANGSVKGSANGSAKGSAKGSGRNGIVRLRGIMLITDEGRLDGRPLLDSVEQAILGGARIVQLRDKQATARSLFEKAGALKRITDRHDVPLIMNDRLDILLAAGAAGVHLGRFDLPVGAARRILGGKALVGASAATVEEAVAAERAGADYLGCGALFPTRTKSDTRPVDAPLLTEIVRSVRIPVFAIGGIGADNLGLLSGTGIAGAAVSSAILADPDPAGAARRLAAILQSDWTDDVRIFVHEVRKPAPSLEIMD